MAKLALVKAIVLSTLLVPQTLSSGGMARDPAARLVVDPRSGLAIFGYDPVAYHLDGRARPGLREYEAMSGGQAWRFVSPSNRAAFLADPGAYAPSFGGHDGSIVAEGALATGDPAIFVIAAGEVVFFRTIENRDRFIADIELRRRAVANWPTALRQFGGH
jgi:hypothetical protein